MRDYVIVVAIWAASMALVSAKLIGFLRADEWQASNLNLGLPRPWDAAEVDSPEDHRSSPDRRTKSFIAHDGERYTCSIPLDYAQEAEPLDMTTEELTNAIEFVEDRLREMKGECLSLHQGFWNYKFCFNKDIEQSGKIHEKTGQRESYLLGRVPTVPKTGKVRQNITKVGGDHAPFFYQSWEYGTICAPTERPRRAEIRYVCKEDEEAIQRVLEPAICSYIVIITTPRICGLPHFNTKPQLSHDVYCEPEDTINPVIWHHLASIEDETMDVKSPGGHEPEPLDVQMKVTAYTEHSSTKAYSEELPLDDHDMVRFEVKFSSRRFGKSVRSIHFGNRFRGRTWAEVQHIAGELSQVLSELHPSTTGPHVVAHDLQEKLDVPTAPIKNPKGFVAKKSDDGERQIGKSHSADQHTLSSSADVDDLNLARMLELSEIDDMTTEQFEEFIASVFKGLLDKNQELLAEIEEMEGGDSPLKITYQTLSSDEVRKIFDGMGSENDVDIDVLLEDVGNVERDEDKKSTNEEQQAGDTDGRKNEQPSRPTSQEKDKEGKVHTIRAQGPETMEHTKGKGIRQEAQIKEPSVKKEAPKSKADTETLHKVIKAISKKRGPKTKKDEL
eukprot:Clim_evm45s119 gene=Clim_evmTU45s119